VLRLDSRQIKTQAFALVVALCGIVLGLLGEVGVFLIFGHMSKAFFDAIHIREEVFTIGVVVLGFAWGWIFGYKEAVKRFSN
jgi:hypothetical protein